MSIISVIKIFLLAILTGASGAGATAQDSAFHVIDFVDLPKHLNPRVPNQDPEQTWSIEFRESWIIFPEKPGILKRVVDFEPNLHNASLLSPDTLQQKFSLFIQQFPQRNGTIRFDNISYEFMLLDPHLKSSGNIAFPEPDSMDAGTRKLQGELIALVKSRSNPANRNALNDQLLSVYFHEEWTLDPVSQQITKKVLGITPVIWQRRQTTDEEPINEADTGLPVYYKNPLDYIDLRHPH